jgi:hypothetical protein
MPGQGPPPPKPKPPAPVDVEAEAAALLGGEAAAGPAAASDTIDFDCPMCDAELHLALELAGKKAPCPSCTRIISVPQPAKRDPKNWQQKPQAMPSAAKRSDEPVPEGAWGSTTATGVSREALLAAKVVQKRKKPKTVTQKYAIPVLAGSAVIGLVVGLWLASKRKEENRELQALDAALDYAVPERYQITDKSLAAMREAHLPEPMVAKLDPLKDKELDRRAFLSALGDRLKKEELDKFERALLTHAALPIKTTLSPAAQAAIFLAAGDYHRRTGKSDSAARAREQYGRGLNILVAPNQEQDNERNVGLLDLALAYVELGGEPAEVEAGERLKWDDVLKPLRAAVPAVAGPDPVKTADARLFVLRSIVRRLTARGQNERAVALVRQLQSGGEADASEALAAVCLELQAAGDTQRAEQLATQALAPYSVKGTRPVLRPIIVALNEVFAKTKLKAIKANGEEELVFLGEVEGLARQDKWSQARDKATKEDHGNLNRFRAEAAIALVAAEAGLAKNAPDDARRRAVDALSAAVGSLAAARPREGLNWLLLRLTEVGLGLGLGADQLDKIIAAIPDPRVKARAQLLQLQDQVRGGASPSEESIAAMPDSVARLMAWEALARAATRRDAAWATTIDAWEQPRQAFASAGVALGLQDHALGK